MSNIIRRYEGIKEMGDGKILEVVAYVGGEEYGKTVGFRIDYNETVVLSEKQVIDLILALLKRIGLKRGYCATDTSEKFDIGDVIIRPDGKFEGEFKND